MSRLSRDEFDRDGHLRNGFDYELQVWVVGYKIQDCGHPKEMRPGCCMASRLAGRDIRDLEVMP